MQISVTFGDPVANVRSLTKSEIRLYERVAVYKHGNTANIARFEE